MNNFFWKFWKNKCREYVKFTKYFDLTIVDIKIWRRHWYRHRNRLDIYPSVRPNRSKTFTSQFNPTQPNLIQSHPTHSGPIRPDASELNSVLSYRTNLYFFKPSSQSSQSKPKPAQGSQSKQKKQKQAIEPARAWVQHSFDDNAMFLFEHQQCHVCSNMLTQGVEAFLSKFGKYFPNNESKEKSAEAFYYSHNPYSQSSSIPPPRSPPPPKKEFLPSAPPRPPLPGRGVSGSGKPSGSGKFFYFYCFFCVF